MDPMSTDPQIREGFVPFRGHHTWYRVAGGGEVIGRLPLILVNGGPGAAHDYFEPLQAWAGSGRRIVFYDQLGSGDSDHPHDPGLWTVELFVEELRAVREALGLACCHLLGQSWGGLLALEHALAHPRGIASLTLADPLVSVPQWGAEAARLRAELPAAVQEALTRHEAAGTTGSPEYKAATMVYYARHVCRLDPWPECLQRAFARLAEDPEVYNTMWGPSEFHVTGTLKEWDVRGRLPGILAPALVLGGRFDECTPAIQEDLQRRLPGSQWTVFEDSAHLPHLEEPERFREVVEGFLERVEGDAL
jgi:proline-specific peptidase